MIKIKDLISHGRLEAAIDELLASPDLFGDQENEIKLINGRYKRIREKGRQNLIKVMI